MSKYITGFVVGIAVMFFTIVFVLDAPDTPQPPAPTPVKARCQTYT